MPLQIHYTRRPPPTCEFRPRIAQFVVRREVYRRIQERFRTQGIEFAHRNVTVYLPPEVTGAADEDVPFPGSAPNKTVLEAGAAAAIAAAETEEFKKKRDQ
jgi:hypothetical protein